MDLTIEQALQQGVTAHKEGKLEEAERLYKTILQSEPAHPDANHNLGVIAVSVNKVELALPLFKAALEANPKIEQFWLSYIDALIKDKQFENAKDFLEGGIKVGLVGDKVDNLEAKLTQIQQAKGQSDNDIGPSQSSLDNLLEHYQNGRYDEAEKLAMSMTRQFPKNQFGWKVLGAVLGQTGRSSEAIKAIQTAVTLSPQDTETHYNLGNTFKELGRLEEAEASYKQAIALKPDFSEAHYNLGYTLKELGRLEEAEASYKQAIVLKPNFSEAHSNLGGTLQNLGRLEEAEASYRQAIALKHDYAKAHCHLGITLQKLGRLDEAKASYTQAIAFKPDYAEAHSNLGATLQELGRLEEAEASLRQAILLKPDLAEAHNNMGVALQDKGDPDAAVDSYKQAIKIKPDYTEAWNNLEFPLQAMKLQITTIEELLTTFNPQADSKHFQIAKSVLNYRLHLGEANAERYLNEASSLLSTLDNTIIRNPNVTNDEPHLKPIGPDKIVALVHFGRSGTGLLHSLIDGHPEVSTLPSVYFSEFFNPSTWEKIIAGGWSEMADRFIATYEVLFDASARNPIGTKSKKTIDYMGQKDGMANVGDKRDEVLRVDKALFREELNYLMSVHNHLDAFAFFQLVHSAHDKALNDVNHKHLNFYHIHNPLNYAVLNFIHAAPKANWVMMVREPLQACESWVISCFDKNERHNISYRIIIMLFEVDNIIYQKQKTIGVRLEDLKESPKQTIPALCDWMGIKETESLYEMTAQGKKWWGDPASPDYKKDGMKPFGKTSIRRKVGAVFTENDQFILRTLFYPFSLRFGYVEENLEQFKADLKTIRPMLDEMFGFEKMMAERTQLNAEQFMKSGSYLYLRSGLIERWNVLAKFYTYPNMIRPLNINFPK